MRSVSWLAPIHVVTVLSCDRRRCRHKMKRGMSQEQKARDRLIECCDRRCSHALLFLNDDDDEHLMHFQVKNAIVGRSQTEIKPRILSNSNKPPATSESPHFQMHHNGTATVLQRLLLHEPSRHIQQ